MHEALYGDAGFYRRQGAPAAHFRTAAHASPLWAQAIARLAGRVDEALGEPDGFTLVDLGAGGGELVAGLAGLVPLRWRLVGVDLAPRPDDLPDRVEWQSEQPSSYAGVLVAVEWLDVVPVDVVERTPAGVRLVEVDLAGEERLGVPPAAADLAWLSRWWPLTEDGDRAEVGRPRDEAWADAVGRLDRGVAVAVDYAAVPARDPAGTLTGYRGGRQVAPVPDGSCDLTAHVLMESCTAAGGGTTSLLRQRQALRDLGVGAARPAYAGDPAAYVASLSAAGEAAELTDPSGLGGFTWLVTAKGVPAPLGG